LEGLGEVEDADFEEVEEYFGIFGEGEFFGIVHVKKDNVVKLSKGK
jgi:hypothetical protein